MSNQNGLKVKVTEFCGFIIINTVNLKEEKGWVPAGGPRIGCVIYPTDNRVGISPEALKLLKSIPNSHDGIGDVDAYLTDKGESCFCWLGPPSRLVDLKKADGSRDTNFNNLKHVVIENSDNGLSDEDKEEIKKCQKKLTE